MSSRSPARRQAGSRRDEVHIRPLMPRDHRAIVALDAANTGMAKPHYWRELFADYGRRRSSRFFLVAEQAGRLVGFVVGEIRAWEFGSVPCGWVLAIEVDAGTRLRRVGTMLIEAIVDCFKSAGVRKLRTMLARDDLLNLRFFRSQGMMAGPFIQLEKNLV
ncbi:MAG TPA: GNAT family N-acetyltransferase [Alphaproteobacteria bacterium]